MVLGTGEDLLYRYRKGVRWTVAGAVCLALAIPLGYYNLEKAGYIRKEELSPLEGRVFDEAFSTIPGGILRRTGAEYSFSIDGGKTLVRVIGNLEDLTSVNARISRGSQVELKARKIGPDEYRAWSEDIHVR